MMDWYLVFFDYSNILLKVHYLGSFSNLESAPIKLNALILQRPFCPMSSLRSTITQHYMRQGLTEWYKVKFSLVSLDYGGKKYLNSHFSQIIGSAAVLGSPVTLVDRLGTGVYDFFHEPAQGFFILIFMQVYFFSFFFQKFQGFVAGPEAFGKGLAKGTKSLLKNTLSGVFGSASKFTEAVSGGLVKVGMDEEWERERRVKALKKPHHVGEGIQQGVVGLGEGVVRGVVGVVTQPVRGYHEEGAVGLVKGVGRGAVGLVLRPAVGMVDVLTRTAEGIQNMGRMWGGEGKRVRVRPPRWIDGEDGVLREYNWEKAARGVCVQEAREGRYGGVKWESEFSFFGGKGGELSWVVPECAKMVSTFVGIIYDLLFY